MHQIHDLALQGTPITEIARQLQISRPTVRKYLEGAPVRQRRERKATQLDPYAAQIRRWVEQDHLYNCVSMLERLRPLGYRGGISQLKAFVHPLRPARAGKRRFCAMRRSPASSCSSTGASSPTRRRARRTKSSASSPS